MHIPGFTGDITTDPAELAAMADDFGHVVHRVPQAVARPRCVDDVVAVLRSETPVVARGYGHASGGQAQTSDGIVLDMRGMATIHEIADDRITVAAGTTWRAVVNAVPDRTPPVLTDYLAVSVGGTLSVGGIGGASHRYGLQTDNVLALDVVTSDGRLVGCSPTVEQNVFHAALAGFGRAGVIVRATLPLVPAPAVVRRAVTPCPDPATLADRLRQLIAEGRFAHVQSQILAVPDGWLYLLETGEHDPGEPLPEPTAELADLPYVEFADRLANGEALLRRTGEWLHPHPWWNAFLPDSTFDAFLSRLLAHLDPAGLGPSGLILTYPIRTEPLRTRQFRVPAEPVVWLVALLRTAAPDDPAELADLVADNDYWYRRAIDAGGMIYPIGTVPAGPPAP